MHGPRKKYGLEPSAKKIKNLHQSVNLVQLSTSYEAYYRVRRLIGSNINDCCFTSTGCIIKMKPDMKTRGMAETLKCNKLITKVTFHHMGAADISGLQTICGRVFLLH